MGRLCKLPGVRDVAKSGGNPRILYEMNYLTKRKMGRVVKSTLFYAVPILPIVAIWNHYGPIPGIIMLMLFACIRGIAISGK